MELSKATVLKKNTKVLVLKLDDSRVVHVKETCEGMYGSYKVGMRLLVAVEANGEYAIPIDEIILGYSGIQAQETTMPLPEERKQTEGERRVRVDFNPSEYTPVDVVKEDVASTIDYLLKIAPPSREMSIALTNFEQGAMWAVKALTVDL